MGDPVVVAAPCDDLDDRFMFVGVDDRGVELEMSAVQLTNLLFLIHVIPTTFRT